MERKKLKNIPYPRNLTSVWNIVQHYSGGAILQNFHYNLLPSVHVYTYFNMFFLFSGSVCSADGGVVSWSVMSVSLISSCVRVLIGSTFGTDVPWRGYNYPGLIRKQLRHTPTHLWNGCLTQWWAITIATSWSWGTSANRLTGPQWRHRKRKFISCNFIKMKRRQRTENNFIVHFKRL